VCYLCSPVEPTLSDPAPCRQQDVLYILTLTTVCIMPLQFLSGLFGMNFVNDDGSPGDPLLTYGWKGYAFFWFIGISLTLFSIWAFRSGQTLLRGTLSNSGKVAKSISKVGRAARKSTEGALRSVQASTADFSSRRISQRSSRRLSVNRLSVNFDEL
jgi:hypothetical protein